MGVGVSSPFLWISLSVSEVDRMADKREDEDGGWRVVQGPGTENTDRDDFPPESDLGKSPVLGAGYGASTSGVDGDPGPTGPAEGEIPENTGPNAIAGIHGLATAPDAETEE